MYEKGNQTTFKAPEPKVIQQILRVGAKGAANKFIPRYNRATQTRPPRESKVVTRKNTDEENDKHSVGSDTMEEADFSEADEGNSKENKNRLKRLRNQRKRGNTTTENTDEEGEIDDESLGLGLGDEGEGEDENASNSKKARKMKSKSTIGMKTEEGSLTQSREHSVEGDEEEADELNDQKIDVKEQAGVKTPSQLAQEEEEKATLEAAEATRG